MRARQQPARDVGEQFRLLVESVEDYAIFLLDTQGNVTSWNPGAERIKGYRAEEIIGRHFSVFYPSEDVDRGKPQSELQVAARDGRFEEEGWRLRRGGTRFWADVVLTAIRDERGRVIGFGKVTAVQDVTEIKRLEDAVREASTPVLRVLEGLLILPLIGMIDSHRARQLTEQLLAAIRRERARAVVIDLTGVPSMNLTIANHLIQTVDASRLLGARVILTGLSSGAAESLVSIGVNLGQFVALGDLQSGIEEAEQWLKAPWKPSLPTATAPDGEDFDQANFPAGTNP